MEGEGAVSGGGTWLSGSIRPQQRARVGVQSKAVGTPGGRMAVGGLEGLSLREVEREEVEGGGERRRCCSSMLPGRLRGEEGRRWAGG